MPSMTARTRWLALYVLCLGDQKIVLDTTIANVALPSIRADLGFSQTSHAWVAWAHNGTPRAAPGSTEIRQASSPPGTWRLLSVIRRSSVA